MVSIVSTTLIPCNRLPDSDNHLKRRLRSVGYHSTQAFTAVQRFDGLLCAADTLELVRDEVVDRKIPSEMAVHQHWHRLTHSVSTMPR
eukprot:m.299243 g.299243  ORF g.299243 m.299243 type:complete len:88 (+) comp20107_c0_seq1:365-628(+)